MAKCTQEAMGMVEATNMDMAKAITVVVTNMGTGTGMSIIMDIIIFKQPSRSWKRFSSCQIFNKEEMKTEIDSRLFKYPTFIMNKQPIKRALCELKEMKYFLDSNVRTTNTLPWGLGNMYRISSIA